MRKFIKQKLRESLRYSHVIGDATKNNYKLSEYNLPMLSLTKEVDATAEEKEIIKGLDYTDIVLEPQNETSPVKIKVSLPLERDLSPGIALDIELVSDKYYQIHISLAESLRKLGLGYKIYKALIMNFGHLYSGKGRRQNKVEIPKIWKNLKKEPGITCKSDKIADICVSDSAPNKDELLKPFKD